MTRSPAAGRILVRLGKRRIAVDGRENAFQADAVLHREHEFRQQVGSMFADNRDAQDTILVGRRKYLDESGSRVVDDRTIQIAERITRDFEGCLLTCRFGFVEPDMSHLGIGERCPWNHRVVHLDVP